MLWGLFFSSVSCYSGTGAVAGTVERALPVVASCKGEHACALCMAASQPDHSLLRATSQAHPYAAAIAMAVWLLYGRPKDEDEVITKLPPIRNIIVVYSF